MNDCIERRGRLHHLIKSTRRRDIRNNAEVEFGASIWKISEHLGSFRLGSDHCPDREALGEKLVEDVRSYEAICAREENSVDHDCEFWQQMSGANQTSLLMII
jgi:hypothetical protein